MKKTARQQAEFNIFANADYYVVSKFADHFNLISREEVKTLEEAIDVASQHGRSLIYAVMKSGRFACVTLSQIKEFINENRPC